MTPEKVYKPQLSKLTDMIIYEGQDVTFTVNVDGKPYPLVEWFKGSEPLAGSPEAKFITAGNKHSLVLKNQTITTKSITITAVAKNKAESVSVSGKLNVQGT